jgi:anti-sigma factor RsiW
VTCSSSEALFEAYLDDTLLPAQRARLLAHLNGCGACKGVLDELRVVDALLGGPLPAALPENFTFATMAEVRSLAPPSCSPAPVYAYIVSYLVASWLLIGTGFLLASTAMRAFGEAALDASAQFTWIFGAAGHAGGRVIGDFGAAGPLIGATIALDVAVVLALFAGFLVVRPRLAERLRP